MSQKLIPKRLRKAAFIFGGKHELQRKGLVLAVGFMRPLLVWRGYWIDEGYVMRITMTIESRDDLEAAMAALRHFIKEKRAGDGTSDSWGIGIADSRYFCVELKRNGNYSVKQSS
ncbi:hypothetical protein LL394_005251 [Serratia marcescens]|uniref:hypothetical protein n=1 Tax=Serratia marcescens TaxID=615 RepID=UPI001A353ACE|nr:hypothetical protein [Serratia marcescens]HAT3742782.1 hypothetical protein [Serratia marcescens]HAT3801059.1 hypothetical protein [Serratia marcescens]